MSHHRYKLVTLAVLALVCSAGLATAIPGERVLVVEDAATGEQLLSVPVAENTTVNLSYTHSVEKTPVYDIYEVRGTHLENTEMRFQSYGWGLPARENVHSENGFFVFNPTNRSYDELYVKPGRIAAHRLTVGEQTYDLVSLSDAHSVRITVESRSVLSTALSP
ncbi:DUF1850 domain-containing protein [Haladaptatus sp. DJG-WS-42]|uniref:DUF1850 domain-containing protein n=1 Tax=Haladaptatus sp. DJG-WS-42 TaxID=3120516 RepID=UPI0030D45842